MYEIFQIPPALVFLFIVAICFFISTIFKLALILVKHLIRLYRRVEHHVDRPVSNVFSRLFLRNKVRHGWKHHPVNAHWHEANTAPWPHLAAKTRQELRDIQDALLLQSNDARLSWAELAYLRAANNHFDVRTCINKLNGRDHAEFGFEGVDQLHFNSTGPFPCGCTLEHAFDHHKSRAGEPHEHHPHFPLSVCDDHAPHQHDLALLRERVNADNQPKGA